MTDQFKIIDVTPNNVQEETLFCIKDIKSPGFILVRNQHGAKCGKHNPIRYI